jgi:excinuclease ABC subunit C
MTKKLQKQLSLLPKAPGIYKFFNKEKEVLYIGKALSLKSRVNSYFSNKHNDRPRIISMIPLIHTLETIQTDNEIEALVLESSLIKKYQPKYNLDLKDDKSYAWIYIDTKSKFPTVKIVRTIKKKEFNKGKLFGPYPNATATKRIFRYIRKMYPFCTNKKPKENELCFYYHLKLCPGPHQGRISEENYRENINNIIKFLQGRKKSHMKDLEKQMKEYAKNQNFEQAAELRDKINDLTYLGSKIKFSYFKTEDDYVQSREERLKQDLKKFAKDLNIAFPHRIECYDISNIQGKLAYGSMVVAIDGVPDNSQYRIFKIKEKDMADDPGMLSEVLRRRLKHIGKGKDSLNQRPDLILLDGAKSQMSVVMKDVPKEYLLMGISKGKRLKRKGQQKIDEFWIRKWGAITQIKPQNTVVLSNIRDESHRFAIYHHRKLRKFVQKKSILDDIQGIGTKRRRELIKTFGSVKEIAKQSEEELYKVIKNEKVVKRLLKKLKANN